MTLQEAHDKAYRGKIFIDNHLMITSYSGQYLAKVDGSEGRKWRAASALLVHSYNVLPEVQEALKLAIEALKASTVSQTFHLTKDQIFDRILPVLEQSNKVESGFNPED